VTLPPPWERETRIRWRDDRGRVVGGHVVGYDAVGNRWRVAVPNWITGDVELLWIDEGRVVIGAVPWPADR
jgi:hypothetical protein